jgi:pantothenate kinase
VITNDFSNGSIEYLSSLIDLSHLDTLSLTSDLYEQSFKNISAIINTLLNRTYNVQSINLCFTRLHNLIEYLDIVFPMISKQVKHLTVDIRSTDEMEWILDRFENFSSITFRAKTQCSSQFDQIIQEFNRKRRDFTFYKGYMYLSFWFGKQKLNK